MNVQISPDARDLGQVAASRAADILNEAIRRRGQARLILSTGQSQFETLEALIRQPVDWSKVTMFHLDEYINLPAAHPASFRKYLQERFISQVNLRAAHLVDGEGDVAVHIQLLNDLISQSPVDLGLIGIGENAHIGFNDPPADFQTESPYIVVNLSQTCKQQQVREGWFADLASVPTQAISMSVRQILKCRAIISCVPHAVKAQAVRLTLTSPVQADVPASILKTHADFNLYLDRDSASELTPDLLARLV